MMIEKAVAKAGLEMTADTLPKGSRSVKSFQRLIAAMRACEAEVLDRLSASERELNESLQANLQLQERVRILEGENLKHRFKNELDTIELTSGSKTKLLELVAS